MNGNEEIIIVFNHNEGIFSPFYAVAEIDNTAGGDTTTAAEQGGEQKRQSELPIVR